MSRIRTFVAIDLGKKVRSRCVALQGAIDAPGVRWVAPETMHITLAFLGDVEDKDLNRVCKAVAAGCAGHEAFTLEIEGVGCFPNPSRPRTIWAGAGEGSEELKALQASIDAALVETGLYRSEEKPFTPHVTLGRFKHGEDISEAVEAQAGWAAGGCPVGEVLVMSSDLRPEGPEYAVLGRVAL
jgi:2'-5' RNA ligase